MRKSFVIGLGLLLASAAGDALAGLSVIPAPKQQQKPARAEARTDPGVEDPAVRELMEQRRKQQEAYDALNRMNPLSQDFEPNTKPAGTGPMAEVQKLLQNPAAQATLSAASHPAVSEAYRAIASHPNRMILLYSEIGLFVFMLIFRAWRQSKAPSWARRLWVSFYSGVLWLGLGAGALPALVLGPDFLARIVQ